MENSDCKSEFLNHKSNGLTLPDRLSKKGDPDAPEPSGGRSERGNKPPINAIRCRHEKA